MDKILSLLIAQRVCVLDIDKSLVTKQDPPHKNIGIELPLGQILKSFVASESRTSLANMAILTKI